MSSRRSRFAWVFWTFGLTLVFGRIGAYNLGNYRPVSNDEVELMSVGYKLATQGTLGSDLFAGFFGADQHFFFVLPLQHILEALSFRLFGVGLAQARWVSLLAGVSLVWVVGWLAYRWYGLGTAMLCEFLLVVWPSNLTLAANGLPLLGVARTARYDVLAVAFTWFAIALLDATLRRPRASTSVGLGMCSGLAALSTFTGTFVLPLVVVNWFWARDRRALVDRALVGIAAGTALILVPWVLYALRYWSDLTGQFAVFGNRGDFLKPSFYLANVVNEASRYGHLSWLLAIGILPAVAFVVFRSRQQQAIGDRLLWSSLVTFSGLLLLLDQTKTPIYALILLPSLCLALASLWTSLFGWIWRRSQNARLRLAATAVSVGLVFSIGLDGVRAYQLYLAQAAQVGQYLGVGQEIDDALPPGGRVLGPERWWWALHEHPYLSLRSLWFQWSAAAASGGTPQFVDWVGWSQAESVIVNDNIRGDVRDFPVALQDQFWTFLSTCTTLVTDLNDPTYLDIQVYAITRPCGG